MPGKPPARRSKPAASAPASEGPSKPVPPDVRVGRKAALRATPEHALREKAVAAVLQDGKSPVATAAAFNVTPARVRAWVREQLSTDALLGVTESEDIRLARCRLRGILDRILEHYGPIALGEKDALKVLNLGDRDAVVGTEPHEAATIVLKAVEATSKLEGLVKPQASQHVGSINIAAMQINNGRMSEQEVVETSAKALPELLEAFAGARRAERKAAA